MMRRWESLTPRLQAAIAFPLFAVILFLVNVGPFNQPLARSILYGIIEGGVVTGLLLVATANEKKKRQPPPSDDD